MMKQNLTWTLGCLAVFLLKYTSGTNSSAEETTSNTLSEESPAFSDIPCKPDEALSTCSIADGLICHDGFCKCAYPNLTYDINLKKCKAMVGHQCAFHLGQKNSSTVACPDNSICAISNFAVANNKDGKTMTDGSEHKCLCVYTHYKTENNSCLPLATFGEACDSRKKCSPDAELKCEQGVCKCLYDDDQFYDKGLKRCISYAGGNCSRYCVANSACDFWGSGTCQCRHDHRLNVQQRQCEPIPAGYLSPCAEESQQFCNSEAGLKCIDKVCQCAFPLHQVYEFQIDKCIGLAGDICDPSGKDSCVEHSSCMKSDQVENQYQCKCNPGYSTTPYRKCMKSLEEPCENEFCNVFRGLACIGGKCQCYDSFLRYNKSAEACLSPVGSPCGKIFIAFRGDFVKSSCPECDSYFFGCEDGGSCIKDYTQSGNIGRLEKYRCKKK